MGHDHLEKQCRGCGQFKTMDCFVRSADDVLPGDFCRDCKPPATVPSTSFIQPSTSLVTYGSGTFRHIVVTEDTEAGEFVTVDLLGGQ